jgi:hypothetical protein
MAKTFIAWVYLMSFVALWIVALCVFIAYREHYYAKHNVRERTAEYIQSLSK